MSRSKGGIFLLTNPCADLHQILDSRDFEGTIFVLKLFISPVFKVRQVRSRNMKNTCPTKN